MVSITLDDRDSAMLEPLRDGAVDVESLAREDETTAAEVRSQVYPDHRAGYESAAESWADCVRDGFEQLPRVERADEGGDRWRYRPDGRGPTSTGPDSGDAGEPVGTERDGGVDATDGVAGAAGSEDEGGAGRTESNSHRTGPVDSRRLPDDRRHWTDSPAGRSDGAPATRVT